MPKTFEFAKYIILLRYVQRCIASSNNSDLDAKNHLSIEIIFEVVVSDYQKLFGVVSSNPTSYASLDQVQLLQIEQHVLT